MELADLLLIVKIMYGLLVSVSDFDEVGRELARPRIALREIGFEIAAVTTNRLT